jgi:hypothetical protein
MASERTPEQAAHFRSELARLESHMTATLQGRASARTRKFLAMRAAWPDLPDAFWHAASRLTHDELLAVSDALDTRYAAGVAQGCAGGGGQ